MWCLGMNTVSVSSKCLICHHAFLFVRVAALSLEPQRLLSLTQHNPRPPTNARDVAVHTSETSFGAETCRPNETRNTVERTLTGENLVGT